MTTNGLTEPLATHVAAENIVAHLVGLTAICVLGNPQRVANRLDPRPLLLECKVRRNLSDNVRPFVYSTVSFVARFMAPITQIFQITLQVILKVGGDRLAEFGLVIFDRDDKIATPLDDVLGNLFLAAPPSLRGGAGRSSPATAQG